ncbi:hypothetical protein [Spiroplasma tabanidicola]|uniref:MOLPALP family lipoprotein n=1 Tax=Spiroplasma tabanidicola TaxID=324079 RepID=A0A6I6C793_9MOLU|nr:hypothetical protein [Spiroplasma tabanidicola]QGS52080.1 hypothetical protein STABA_v1c07240 [Spiroplasma tabanidicola]
MKKLLAVLCSLSISSTLFSVTSCSLVNYEKQYVKNKVNSLVDIASLASRSAILNDVEGIDVDYLNTFIGNKKIKDLEPNFSASDQASTSSVVNSVFDKTLDRSYYENLASNSEYNLSSKTSPNSYADSIVDNGLLILSTIKSSGGIKPSLGGVIEGLIPQLSSIFGNLKNEFNIDKNWSDSLSQLAPYAQQLINDLDKTNLISTICRLLFNINFINDKKVDDSVIDNLTPMILGTNSEKVTNIPFIIEDYINNVMFKDFKGQYKDKFNETHKIDLTLKVVQQSALRKLNRFLYNLSGNEDNNLKAELSLDDYLPIDNSSWFRNNLAQSLGYIIKNTDKLNYASILENINDIFYILSSLIINIGLFDFEQINNDLSTNISEEHLFEKQRTNKEVFKELNDQSNQNHLVISFNSELEKQNGIITNNIKTKRKFSIYSFLKNISLAINPNADKGRDMQRILFLLLYSNSPTKQDYLIPENLGLLDVLSLGSDKLEQEVTGTDSLLNGVIQALGFKLFDILKDISLPEFLKNIGALAASRLFGITGDSIVNDRSIMGLSSLLKLINSFTDTGISISDESTNKLQNGFQALWNKDSNVLTELTGWKINNKSLNFVNIFSMEITSGLYLNTILKIFSEIYNENSEARSKYNSEKEKNQQGNVSDGIKKFASSATNKFKVYFNNKINSDEGLVKDLKGTSGNSSGEYNTLTTALSLMKYNGLALRDDDYKNNNLSFAGYKGLMYALGYKEGVNEFKDNSILKAAEIIFDDNHFENIMTNTLDDFKFLSNTKKEYIKDKIEPLIDSKNFVSKLLTYSEIDNKNILGTISFEISYTPINKNIYKYQITLMENSKMENWKISEVKKIA